MDELIACPICDNDSGIHLVGYAPYFEKDNRLCLCLTFLCECGHHFELYLHQHEGVTYLTSSKKRID